MEDSFVKIDFASLLKFFSFSVNTFTNRTYCAQKANRKAEKLLDVDLILPVHYLLTLVKDSGKRSMWTYFP